MGVELVVGLLTAAAGAAVAANNAPDAPDIITPPTPEKAKPAASKAASRTRKREAGTSSRSDTILTGPIGLPDEQAGGAKTLLGS